MAIPHAGNPALARTVASVAAAAERLDGSAEILAVDDRRDARTPLRLPPADAVRMRVVRTRGGAGFAAAANAGIAAAAADLVLLLNDDAELHPGALAALLAEADAHPEAGAFQAKVLSAADPGMFDYAGAAGGMIDRYGYPFCLGRVLDRTGRDEGQFDAPRRIFWAAGCAMLLRRSALERTGGLHEGFRMHMEEIDLCWRMWRAGIEARSAPAAAVFHDGGGTLRRGSLRKSYMNHRNHWLLIFRNLPPRALAAAVAVRAALDAVETGWSLAALRWRNAAAVPAAAAWAVFNLRTLLRARKDARGPYLLPAAAPVYRGSMVLAALRGASSGGLAAAAAPGRAGAELDAAGPGE